MPVLARRRLLIVILSLLVLGMPATASARMDRVEHQVVRSLNAIRAAYGLRALRVDGRLGAAAAGHSRFMARTGYFTHGNFAARVSRAARTRQVGEVLAYLSRVPGGWQARVVLRNWLNSPPHRAVLLSGAYHRVGVGRARGRGLTFFTADLAR